MFFWADNVSISPRACIQEPDPGTTIYVPPTCSRFRENYKGSIN